MCTGSTHFKWTKQSENNRNNHDYNSHYSFFCKGFQNNVDVKSNERALGIIPIIQYGSATIIVVVPWLWRRYEYIRNSSVAGNFKHPNVAAEFRVLTVVKWSDTDHWWKTRGGWTYAVRGKDDLPSLCICTRRSKGGVSNKKAWNNIQCKKKK